MQRHPASFDCRAEMALAPKDRHFMAARCRNSRDAQPIPDRFGVARFRQIQCVADRAAGEGQCRAHFRISDGNCLLIPGRGAEHMVFPARRAKTAFPFLGPLLPPVAWPG